MQSASSNFSEAISGASVTWAPPRVFADWDRTGYGADGSIDDLSAQVGDSFTVAHHLDDGLPEQVSFVSGVGSPTLDTPLEYGRTDYGQTNRRASTYFSPYNTTSPVSGFDRDVAPVTLDWGAITKAGPEYVRLFTGQMMNIPVRGQGAELQAMSATRNKLRKLVQPPAVVGDDNGLNATWPIVWTLAQAGIYVSPPPRPGCRWWAPMSGSLRPIPSDRDVWGGGTHMIQTILSAPLDGEFIRPRFIPGPYLLGADCVVTPSEARGVSNDMGLESGADVLSKAGSTGRIEFWVKGDPANFSTAPGGAGSYPSDYVAFEYRNNGTPTTLVRFGIQGDRKAFLRIDDGSGTLWQVATVAPLPTDGKWYFVGGSWDLSNASGSVMAIRQFDGTTSYYVPGPTATNLPAVDDPYLGGPYIDSYLPIAEVQLSTGPGVSLQTAAVWVDQPGYAWTPGATIRPSILELVALAEPTPREAWEFIGSFAQAELATMRTNERDLFEYLPMSYWAEPAQQVVSDALSTSVNMADIDVDMDPSKIRNSVSVDYSDTRIDPELAKLLLFKEVREIPPGKSTLTLAFDKPAVWIGYPVGEIMNNSTASDVSLGIETSHTVNSSRDGTGTYRTSDEVAVSVVDWDPGIITLAIDNKTDSTQYFANNGGVATIVVEGSTPVSTTASAVAQDASSVARRGERGLSVSLPAIQRREDAAMIAAELAARLAKPRPVIADVELFPDPRRQPGDLVTLTDEVNTMASGLWRTQSITHTRSGDDYTQTATLRRAMLVGRWDVDAWDDFIWGP